MTLPPRAENWVGPAAQSGDVAAEMIVAPMFARRRWSWLWWWAAFIVCVLMTILTAVSVSWLLAHGIGIWGLNTSVVWGFAIANYVWWIGISNAGTMISGMLLLTRQPWRATINRLAQTMALFAAAIAGVFPIFHLGRPLYFYWLAPYPNVMALWPQWRSALIWDFWSIASYMIFAILFLYIELIPDLATLRDRSRRPVARVLYGAFALGWRGSARHWHIYRVYHVTLACLAIPIFVAVHSVVALDFAASLMPMWSEAIFPPYFVVEAMYSGFAMICVLAAVARWGLHLQALITERHFAVMAKIMLACAILMSLFFLTEYFSAFYTGEHADRGAVVYAFTGDYRVLYWAMLVCICGSAHLFWSARLRNNVAVVTIVAIAVNAGVWLDQITIIWNTLGHGYAVSMWRVFYPTFWDYSLMLGSVAVFALMYLVATRLLPLVSIHATRELLSSEARQ